MKNSQFCLICALLLLILANTEAKPKSLLAAIWCFVAVLFFILALCAKD